MGLAGRASDALALWRRFHEVLDRGRLHRSSLENSDEIVRQPKRDDQLGVYLEVDDARAFKPTHGRDRDSTALREVGLPPIQRDAPIANGSRSSSEKVTLRRKR